MKEKKRILAILAVVLILAVFCMPMIFALGKGEKAGQYFRVSLGLALICPILIYICMMIYRGVSSRNKLPESGVHDIFFGAFLQKAAGDEELDAWTAYLKNRGYRLHSLGTGNEDIRSCLKDTGLNAAECVLIDDSQENLDDADKLGIKTVRFVSFRQAVEELKKLGIR